MLTSADPDGPGSPCDVVRAGSNWASRTIVPINWPDCGLFARARARLDFGTFDLLRVFDIPPPVTVLIDATAHSKKYIR